MRHKNLILRAQIYRYYAIKRAVDAGSLKELSKLETFTDRIKYAEEHWKHLSSGSSRVIYVLDDGRVLKLAKNKKGLAQNIAESDPKMKSKYINPTIEYDKEGIWKISPYLDKITEKEFEELTDMNFKEFGEALEYGLQEIGADSDDSAKETKPKNFEKINQSSMYKELVKIGKKQHLMPGDLSRISSWGRNNDHPVLLDTGLNLEIYDEFYE